MEMDSLLLIFTLANVSCSIISKWFSTHKRMPPFYVFDGVAGAFMIITNTFAYMKDHSNYGLLAYYLLGGWQICMACWGYFRKS
jgi:hypothetical protein